MAELDGGAHQLDVLLAAVVDEPTDEGAVELELGDGEAPQIGERGEARTEVVDGDAEAVAAQLLDDLPASLEVANDRCLGDLEDQCRTPGRDGAAAPIGPRR